MTAIRGRGGPGDIAGGSDAAAAPAHRAVAASTIEALAAEVAAGRLSSREVTRELIDRLVETAGGIGVAERAELRELLLDLVTNDPTLGGLVGRL
jgi:hypothetical protein